MNQSNTSSPRGLEVTPESQRGVMAIEVSQNEEISGCGKNGGRKKSVLPSVGEERIGGAYTLRKESEEELLREMLTPT